MIGSNPCNRPIPHLDLNLLRVFDEVMAERSLTRAAHKLAITQPASATPARLREPGRRAGAGPGRGAHAAALALWPGARGLAALQSAWPETFDPAGPTPPSCWPWPTPPPPR
jgi:hypothetical protein